MEDIKTVKLTDSETNEVIEFEVVEEIKLEGNTYEILAPLDNDEDAYVYKVVGEGEDASYESVEDEDEFNKVLAEYDRLFDEEFNN